MNFLKRYSEFYKNNGFTKTLQKIISKPLRYINKKIAYKNFRNTRKEIFTH